MKVKRYSNSLLAIQCPRRLLLKLQEKPKEGLPSEIAEEGLDLHHEAELALKTGDFSRLEEELPHDCSFLKSLFKLKVVAEEWVETEIDGYPIVGKIDLPIEKEHKIVDIKSRWQPNIIKSDEAQLRKYAWFKLNQGWDEVQTSIYFIRYDIEKGYESFDTFSEPLLRKEILAEIDRVKAIADSEEEKAIPNSIDCMFCDWSVSCPIVELQDNMDLEQLAAEVVKRHNSFKALENILKDKLDKNIDSPGAVEIGGDKMMGWHLYESNKIDPREVLASTEGENKIIPIEEALDVLSVSSTAFKKAIKKYPELANLIEVQQKVKWVGPKGWKI
jgi:CRISPR/Cas system-associated exonuclease Cas4 (RecB family)